MYGEITADCVHCGVRSTIVFAAVYLYLNVKVNHQQHKDLDFMIPTIPVLITLPTGPVRYG
jgi:hypothetical protein